MSPEKYQNLSKLSDEDREFYQTGRIDSDSRSLGVIMSYFLGFGIGHGVAGGGLYSEFGWFFTVSELATIGMTAGGIVLSANLSGSGPPLVVLGTFAWIGLRIGEVVDIYLRSRRHNERWTEIDDSLEGKTSFIRSWDLGPGFAASSGPSAGLALRLHF
ncbi:MAG: hypothetical protein ACXWPM_11295 [Bdellovibrionota bacterium]